MKVPQDFHPSNVGYQKRFCSRFQSNVKPGFSKQHFDKLNINAKRNVIFQPRQPHFPNPSSKKPSNASFSKGINDVKNINHWLEGKCKVFQTGKFS